MAKKREFGEGPIYTITNYVFWLLMGTIYFALCNILFIFVFFTPVDQQNVDASYLTLLIISLIPSGPAITALMSAMGKLVREKDVNITKDYFKAYKQSFGQSLFIWVIILAVMTILLVDLSFFRTKPYGMVLVPVVYALMLVIVLMSFYIFPIISRFYLNTKDVLKLAFYFTVSKIKITFLNISAVIIGYFVLWKFSSVGMFFAASGVCFLIMFYQKDMLKELEEKFKTNMERQEKIEE